MLIYIDLEGTKCAIREELVAGIEEYDFVKMCAAGDDPDKFRDCKPGIIRVSIKWDGSNKIYTQTPAADLVKAMGYWQTLPVR